jgi:two-component system, NtrC family, response regulator HydG
MTVKLNILIVDDDQRMTRTLSDILSVAGYNAEEAHSGEEALEKIDAQSIDCVLTDVRMPGMNGVEFHRQLRQVRPGLPVILMTAFAADDIICQGLEEGAVGVLEKPLDINLVLTLFASLSRNRAIVVVDDDPGFCKTIGDILQKRGFNVVLITDPHTSVETMASDSQVILLDMKLKGVDALQVLRELRARYPSLPVVMVTGYRQEMEAAIKSALEINAYACLYKPLEIPALLEMLSKIQLARLRDVIRR